MSRTKPKPLKRINKPIVAVVYLLSLVILGLMTTQLNKN